MFAGEIMTRAFYDNFAAFGAFLARAAKPQRVRINALFLIATYLTDKYNVYRGIARGNIALHISLASWAELHDSIVTISLKI